MAFPRRAPVTREKFHYELTLAAAVAATTTFALGLSDGPYIVDKFELIVPATYTQDPSNYYAITLQGGPAGASVLATISLQTGAQGTATANIPLVSGAITQLATSAANDILQVICTKNGTAANLAAQTRLVAHFHQL